MLGENRVVGLKQSRRAIRDGLAARVYIALDAEAKIRTPILSLCQEKNLPVVEVATMHQLGNMFGITMNASVAAELV